MKKTLRELLQEKKYQKCNVKIGSNKGSSFWYCGKVDNQISLPTIRKIREQLLSQSKSVLKQLNYRLNNLDKIYEKTIQEAKKKNLKNIENHIKKLLITKERERQLLPKKIKSVEYDIDTPLLDRQVVEVVEGISPDEKPCWVVYIKGNERGWYWTIQEAMKGKKIYDN